jgi:hypothetical protein
MFNNFWTDSNFDYSKLTFREKLVAITKSWTNDCSVYFLNYAPCKEVLKISVQPKFSDEERQIRRAICVWLLHRWGFRISELQICRYEVCDDDLKDMEKRTKKAKKSKFRLVRG